MKPRWVIAVLALVVVAALTVMPGGRGSHRTRTAPGFMLPDLSDGVVRLNELRGKVVLLNLWATWCAPCVEEMPTLEQLHRRMKGQDFVLLAVSEDEDSGAVSPWIEQRGFTFSVLLDPRGQVGYDYGATGYPETFVIDRQGTIVHHHIGYRDWTEPAMVEALEHLLATGEWRLTSR